MQTQALALISDRFGRDTLLSLATLEGDRPSVRIVNSYYKDGAFYTVTHARSNKIRHLAHCPNVAVCGEWFTAHGIGENIGHPREEKNEALMHELRAAFASWYDNGHTDENDPDTCILRVRLTDGILFSNGKRYAIDFP
ncbi:MAG: pyridoxamine 5'-phosphate oxidase family protein [Christensenellales bacterium]|jgi:general stress protein 26